VPHVELNALVKVPEAGPIEALDLKLRLYYTGMPAHSGDRPIASMHSICHAEHCPPQRST